MLFVWYPNCSTCKKAKAFLDIRGAAYTARDIKADRPAEAELRAWQAADGLPLKKLFNTSGQLYKSLALKDKLPAMGEDEQFCPAGRRRHAGQAAHPGIGRRPGAGGL